MAKKTEGRRLGCDWEYTIRKHSAEHWGWTAILRDKKMSGCETTEAAAMGAAQIAVSALIKRHKRAGLGQADAETETQATE